MFELIALLLSATADAVTIAIVDVATSVAAPVVVVGAAVAIVVGWWTGRVRERFVQQIHSHLVCTRLCNVV